MVYIDAQSEKEPEVEIASEAADTGQLEAGRPRVKCKRRKRSVMVRWLIIGIICGSATFALIAALFWSKILSFIS